MNTPITDINSTQVQDLLADPNNVNVSENIPANLIQATSQIDPFADLNQAFSNQNQQYSNPSAYGYQTPSFPPSQYPNYQQQIPMSYHPQQYVQQQNFQSFQDPWYQQPISMNYPPQQYIQQAPMNHTSYSQPSFGLSSYPSALRRISVNYADDDPLPTDQQTVKPTPTGETPSIDELEKSIQLSLRLKKSTLRSSSFAEQTLPMLVSLKVESLKSTSKAPLDLVCVIDHSGSMAGEKMELVKNTFNYLLEYLSDSDRLSIVLFDDTASRLTHLMRMTKENKQVTLDRLKPVRDNGGTDIELGMCHAIQILKQRKHLNPVSSIFLLSDGLDGGAQHKVSASIKDAELSENITINTFGFGNDHDPQLMNDIAALRDGNFYFINKLDTIDEAFVDCLGGALSSVAQNVTITIQPEQSEVFNGVQITKAYGEASMWSTDDSAQIYSTKMVTLISGKQKDYVLELKIPTQGQQLLDNQKSIKIASAKAEMTNLSGEKIVKNADLVINLLNEDEELPNEEDDREVMKNFYRVKGALLMTEARVLADQSKNEDAKKLLEEFKAVLENSFMKSEEFIVNLIKDINAAIEAVNPRVYHDYGRQNMYMNSRAQMYQQSNLASANAYQNTMQFDMIQNVKAKKAGF